jgi:hypothetical protein
MSKQMRDENYVYESILPITYNFSH